MPICLPRPLPRSRCSLLFVSLVNFSQVAEGGMESCSVCSNLYVVSRHGVVEVKGQVYLLIVFYSCIDRIKHTIILCRLEIIYIYWLQPRLGTILGRIQEARHS